MIARSSTPLPPPATVDQKIELVTVWPADEELQRRIGAPPPVVVASLRKRRPSRVTPPGAVTCGVADDRRFARAAGRVAAADRVAGLRAEDGDADVDVQILVIGAGRDQDGVAVDWPRRSLPGW